MLKIVDATNRRAVRALLAPERIRDAAVRVSFNEGEKKVQDLKTSRRIE